MKPYNKIVKLKQYRGCLWQPLKSKSWNIKGKERLNALLPLYNPMFIYYAITALGKGKAKPAKRPAKSTPDQSDEESPVQGTHPVAY